MASRAFFVPKPAAAPAAPKPAAFPAAIIAGIAAASGNMPPFCRCRRFLIRRPRCFLCLLFRTVLVFTMNTRIQSVFFIVC